MKGNQKKTIVTTKISVYSALLFTNHLKHTWFYFDLT